MNAIQPIKTMTIAVAVLAVGCAAKVYAQTAASSHRSSPSQIKGATNSATIAVRRPSPQDIASLPTAVIQVPSSGAPLAGAQLDASNDSLREQAAQMMSHPLAGSDSARLSTRSVAGAGSACVESNMMGPPAKESKITPGGLVVLPGCGFGDAHGTVKMLGNFPGGSVTLLDRIWAPTVVGVGIPPTLSGVVDHDVRFQLITADGRVSNLQPARFLARRVTVELPESQIASLECADPQPSQCASDSYEDARWASGNHWGADSQAGRDLWRLAISPAWKVERIEARLYATGNPAVLPRDSSSPSQQTVALDWRSVARAGADYYTSFYLLRFFVTGPAGVPFVGEGQGGGAMHGDRER